MNEHRKSARAPWKHAGKHRLTTLGPLGLEITISIIITISTIIISMISTIILIMSIILVLPLLLLGLHPLGRRDATVGALERFIFAWLGRRF